MSDAWTAAFGSGGVAAIVTALASYVLARRNQSGRVATTDADGLWKRLIGELDKRDITITGLQSKVIEMLREQERLGREVAHKDALIAHLEERITELTANHAKEMGELRAEMTRKDERIAILEAERLALNTRVIDLETRLAAKDMEGGK